MKNIFKSIGHWFSGVARTFCRECLTVIHDQGVMIFFVVLPLMYPVVYTLIYNPEVVRDLPIAVVDDDRSPASRRLVREMDATPSMALYNYCSNISEAKELMSENKVFGILWIPEEYGKKIGRMETAHAQFYSQMSLLLRYRAFFSAWADVQMQDIAVITQDRKNMLGSAASNLQGAPINSEAHMLGVEEQGFASFIMPGIVVLILQQSMVLGICMLCGTSRERRRRYGTDLRDLPGVSASATVWGRSLCYAVLYIAPSIFLLHCVPYMFNLPHVGDSWQIMLFALPFVLATAFFGQTLAYFVKDRESTFLIVVFTSVIFLFLSGLTWPRYAFPEIWTWVGNTIPGVWAVEGFIRMNSNAGSLAENSTPYLALWILTGVYFLASIVVVRLVRKRP